MAVAGAGSYWIWTRLSALALALLDLDFALVLIDSSYSVPSLKTEVAVRPYFSSP